MMKRKMFCLTLSAMLILSACAPKNESSPAVQSSDEVQSEVNSYDEVQSSDEIQYSNKVQALNERVYLYVPSEAITTITTTGFKTASEYGLYTQTEYVEYDDMKNSTVLSPEGQTLQYRRSDCKKKSNSSEELGTFYSRYDVYENGEETVRKLHGSEIMVFYSRSFNSDTNYPEMNETQVREIAEQFLKENVSEDVLNNFEFDYMNTDILGRYALLYRRYVEGYRTDENISIWVDRDGRVSGYNGYNLGKYDNRDESITREDISASEKLLLNKLDSMNEQDLKCNGIKLTTDTAGNLFLTMYISYIGVNGEEFGEICAVSVVDV